MWFNLILCLVLTRPLASVPLRPNSHHWSSEDLLLLREEAKDTRNGLLHWWHPSRVLQVAVHRGHCRDNRILEFIRVRCAFLTAAHTSLDHVHRDFFPVILTFLRQLPFIGSILQLPYIRDVRYHIRAHALMLTREFRLQTG